MRTSTNGCLNLIKKALSSRFNSQKVTIREKPFSDEKFIIYVYTSNQGRFVVPAANIGVEEKGKFL